MIIKVYDLILNQDTYITELNTIREIDVNINNKFDTVNKIVELMVKYFGMHNKADEYLYLLTFNTSMKLLGVFEISHGTSNRSIADGRGVYMRALMIGANNIILVHNHPSFSLIPSKDDLSLTKALKEIGDMLGIKMVDHIIIAGDQYLSFKEKDIL